MTDIEVNPVDTSYSKWLKLFHKQGRDPNISRSVYTSLVDLLSRMEVIAKRLKKEEEKTLLPPIIWASYDGGDIRLTWYQDLIVCEMSSYEISFRTWVCKSHVVRETNYSCDNTVNGRQGFSDFLSDYIIVPLT